MAEHQLRACETTGFLPDALCESEALYDREGSDYIEYLWPFPHLIL